MWKYVSLRSIVTNQSSDLICGTICLKVNILNLSCMTESFRTRRSKMGRNPPILLWNYEIPAVKPGFPVGVGRYSMALFSNRAFTSCSITRTCWEASLVENTPINLGGRDPNCIDTLLSIIGRTQQDIFGRRPPRRSRQRRSPPVRSRQGRKPPRGSR